MMTGTPGFPGMTIAGASESAAAGTAADSQAANPTKTDASARIGKPPAPPHSELGGILDQMMKCEFSPPAELHGNLNRGLPRRTRGRPAWATAGFAASHPT